LDPAIDGAHLGLGLAWAAQGKLDEAVKEFKAELDKNPKDARVHLWLGKVALRRGELEEAFPYLKKAITLEPGLAAAHADLGALYQQRREHSRAEAAYRQALAIDSELKEALLGLAQTLRSQQRGEEAKPYLDQLQRQQKSQTDAGLAPGFNARGLEFLRSGQLQAAEKSFREALAVAPSFGYAAHNLAVVLARQGRANEAAEAFRLAIRVHPTFAAAYQGLASLLKQSGDPRAAQLLAEAELLKKVAPQSQDLVLIK
jgi:tetratricopeptide (TPR) repeat protein